MTILDALKELEKNPKDVRFARLMTLCETFFGAPRMSSGSHRIFKTPWAGDPRINVQERGGKAKPEQVKNVIKALHRLHQSQGK